MTNPLKDGLSKPSILDSLNGQTIDFGTVAGSGNTSIVTFTKTFSTTPNVFCFPTVGSVAVASLSVVSNLNAGSFSVATGSNIANYWIAIGSGTY